MPAMYCITNLRYICSISFSSAILLIQKKGKIKPSEVKKRFKVSLSTIVRDLNMLVALGRIKKRGRTRGLIYYI